ncbi:hypothetical protein Xen7305DRAFT_00003190 [Xenococcus sp. PCC 7305]|uniref:hypothetical protein n=1 Tax=Xenococcus sp. PCC 7305 TaxID=102125 RepID=UPI0002ACDD28|nr:hypothetical protein [Xenococcus sp. PCC 7305]ELS00618.1 hypothetical protein Xen7305DRAFT_00003190 [Xenococcus sp. PCC 7305]
MKFRVQLKSWLTICSTFFMVVACRPVLFTNDQLPCDPPSVDKAPDISAPLKISINVDGSGSMYGYVKNNSSSRYAQTITLLDSVVNLGSGSRSQVEIEHYRIGEKTTQLIKENQYQKARLAEFYTGESPEFPEVSSHLDVAIENPEEEDQLLILVTDLDQQGSDLNKLNKKIQRTYFNKQLPGYAVGILGIRSEYNHTVYSVNKSLFPDFEYTTQGEELESYRPFYVVFLGHYQDIVHYVEKIQQKKPDLFNTSEFSLFYPEHIVSKITTLQNSASFPPDLIRPSSLQNGKVAVEVTSPPYEIIEAPKRIDNSRPNLKYTLPFTPLKYSLPINNNSIITQTEVFTYNFDSESFTANNSDSLNKAINLTDWKITDDNLNFTSTINLDSITNPGIYIFKINAMVKNFQDEEWWSQWDFSSRTSDRDGSKTHNLLNFMENLKRTTIDLMEEPSIGYFCYAIQKN